MYSSIATASLGLDKLEKRSIDTSAHDTTAAIALGIVGALAIVLIGLLVWYFRRHWANPDNIQSRRVDLLEDYQKFPEDVEKGSSERRSSMAPSTSSTVLSTETRAIVVALPTPAVPVQTTTRQRVSSVARPFSMSQKIPVASKLPAGTDHVKASNVGGMSTANAQIPSIRVPTISSLPNNPASRMTIHNITTGDISPSTPSPIAEVDEPNPTPVEEQPIPSIFRYKSAKKPRPSDLIISRQTISRVSTKGKVTPNVPASPSQNEWSAGPVATPSTSSHRLRIPEILFPPLAELP